MNQEQPSLSIIRDAAQVAQSDWETANARLETTRSAFNNGAVIRLKDIQGKQSALQEKLRECIADQNHVDAEFKAAFEAAGFEKTPAVQKILNKKSDAMSIHGALEAAIKRLSDEHKPVLLQATEEARVYDAAYRAAFHSYGRMRAMTLLVEHGQAMVDALGFALRVETLKPGIESGNGRSLGYSDSMDKWVKQGRMDAVLEALKNQALAAPDPTSKIIEVIGTLDGRVRIFV